MNVLPMWQQLLADRGILDAAQLAGDWKPEGQGWKYPIYTDPNGRTVHRWKAFDSSANPKYLWPDGKPEDAKYYLLPGAVEAIRESGAVYLASGEPDVLAYKAAGIANCLCWYGERNVPNSLLDDLQDWEVLTVYLYPDRDETGMQMARIVRDRLHGVIQFKPYALPERLGDKGDINKLWIDCAFDAERFVGELVSCADLHIPESEPNSRSEYTDLPIGFYEALDRAFIARGVKRYDTDGWSNLIPCVFTEHEHDKEHPAGSWNREGHFFKCFKCGSDKVRLAIETGDVLGLDWRDFVPRKQRQLTIHQAAPDAVAPTEKPAEQVVFSWAEATETVLAEIDGEVDGSAHEPLPMPFGDLRAMGGFAAALPPRKMLAIVGDSGDGKTSLTETFVDHWRRRGFSGVMWGPEWSRIEYVYRAIQRAGGPSLMQMIHHKAWHTAAKRGIPEHKRPGKPLSIEDYNEAKRLAHEINEWPGKLTFVERLGMQMDELLTRLGEVVTGAELHGEHINFVVCDYAQLFRSTGDKANDRIDRALADLKGFCVDRDLVGVVGNQVTKQDGRAAADGAKLSQASMMNARGDYFNLILIINRELDHEGQKMPNATVRVAKNSLGKMGDIPLRLNEQQMKWYGVQSDPINIG